MAYPLKRSNQYNYASAYAPIHPYTLPQKLRPRRKKPVSLNPIKTLFSLIFLGAIGYYVMPSVYTDFFEPMFLNRYFNRHIKPNMAQYVLPTQKYLSNGTLFGKTLLVAPSQSKVFTPIISSGTNYTVESKLKSLMASYPHLKPSIYIWDYSTGESVEINSGVPIPTASMIKIPILFELFRQIEDRKYGVQENLSTSVKFEELYRTSGSGDLQYKPSGVEYSVDYLANIMITKSDNTATNILLEHIGGKDGLNRAFRGWGLKDSSMSQWLPDLEGANAMSAKDLSTVLYNLDNPTFLEPEYKEQVKNYMFKVENKTLLRAGIPEDAMLFHKTGDIGTMLGDAGVVYRADGKKYIITVMVKRAHNDYSARDFVKEVSQIAYNNL